MKRRRGRPKNSLSCSIGSKKAVLFSLTKTRSEERQNKASWVERCQWTDFPLMTAHTSTIPHICHLYNRNHCRCRNTLYRKNCRYGQRWGTMSERNFLTFRSSNGAGPHSASGSTSTATTVATTTLWQKDYQDGYG